MLIDIFVCIVGLIGMGFYYTEGNLLVVLGCLMVTFYAISNYFDRKLKGSRYDPDAG